MYNRSTLYSLLQPIVHRDNELYNKLMRINSRTTARFASELWVVENRYKVGFKKLKHNKNHIEDCESCKELWEESIDNPCQICCQCDKCRRSRFFKRDETIEYCKNMELPGYIISNGLRRHSYSYPQTEETEDFFKKKNAIISFFRNNSNQIEINSEFISLWITRRNNFNSAQKCFKNILKEITKKHWNEIINIYWKNKIVSQILVFLHNTIDEVVIPEKLVNYHTNMDYRRQLAPETSVMTTLIACMHYILNTRKQSKLNRLYKHEQLESVFYGIIRGDYDDELFCQCYICLNNLCIPRESSGKGANCTHIFHKLCLEQWTNPCCINTYHESYDTYDCSICIRNTCPTCRTPIV